MLNPQDHSLAKGLDSSAKSIANTKKHSSKRGSLGRKLVQELIDSGIPYDHQHLLSYQYVSSQKAFELTGHKYKYVGSLEVVDTDDKYIKELERQIEAILFAAEEPLDIETIEKRVQTTKNIKKILENLKKDYDSRGINLVYFRNKWSFRTPEDLSKLMSLQ